MNIGKGAPSVFASVWGEIGRNARLRLALALVAALVLLYGWLALDTHVDALQRAYDEKLVELSKLQALAKETQWPKRLVQADKALVNARKLLGDAASPGEAQAQFQASLSVLAKDAGIQNLQLVAHEPRTEKNMKNIYSVGADVHGLHSAPVFDKFLLSLSNASPRYSVETLEIIRQENGRFSMTIRAWYRVSGALK